MPTATLQTLELETKFDTGEAGSFTGYASIFGGGPDRMGDVIAPGAFKASLAQHQAEGTAPMLLWQHDPTEPIGVIEDIREDSRGLLIKGCLVLETRRATEAHALLKAGALKGLSIGFRASRSERRPGGGRTLKEIELFEISLVSIPAQSRARVTSVKSNTRKGTTMAENLKDHDLDDLDEGDDIAERLDALEVSINDRFKALDQTVTSMKSAADRLETKLKRPGAKAEAKEDQRAAASKAFTSFIRKGVETMPADETKDLSVSTDTAGGYLVPEDFRAELIRNLVEISPVRQAARISRTSRDKVTLPRRTGTLTAAWTAETATTAETHPAYGQKDIPVHEARAYVDVSNALLEDAGLDIAAELARDFAEEFGRLEGVAFVNGDGVGKPLGFMSDPDIAADTAASATALDADELIDLFHAVPAFYRTRGVWMMNSSTMGAVRKLKASGSGEYLWQDSLADGDPATFLGRPVIDAPDMDNVAIGLSPIVFGDFLQAYRIVDRVDLSILRDPYSVQTSGLVRFHARRRVGGDVVKAEALRKLTMA